jgi:ABC-type polysaccharide/polyol phosphate export permease
MTSARAALRFTLSLARRDLTAQGEGSVLGPVWLLIQPLLFFGLVYMVFTYGLRVSSVANEPFVLWFMIGYIPWVYFASCLTDMTWLIRSYSYLLPHQSVDPAVLPLVKIVSHAGVHAIFLIAVILFGISQGQAVGLATFGIVIYFLLMVALLVGLGWAVAAISVFSKDASNLVLLISQFGFWLTPIFWDVSQLPEKAQWLVQLNPMHYVVAGYRRCFFDYSYSAEQLLRDGLFFVTIIVLLFAGRYVFRRLQPHFLEVLN